MTGEKYNHNRLVSRTRTHSTTGLTNCLTVSICFEAAMKAKDQSTRDQDVKLAEFSKIVGEQFPPIAAVWVVTTIVLILTLDALGTTEGFRTVITWSYGGLSGAFFGRYIKRRIMAIWKSQNTGTERNHSTKEESARQ